MMLTIYLLPECNAKTIQNQLGRLPKQHAAETTDGDGLTTPVTTPKKRQGQGLGSKKTPVKKSKKVDVEDAGDDEEE